MPKLTAAPAVAIAPAAPPAPKLGPVVPPIAPAAPRVPVAPAVPAVNVSPPGVRPPAARPAAQPPPAPAPSVPGAPPAMAPLPTMPSVAPLVPPVARAAPPAPTAQGQRPQGMAPPTLAAAKPPAPAIRPVAPAQAPARAPLPSVAPVAPPADAPVSETGAVEALSPSQKRTLLERVAGLAALDYFQVLGLAHDAAPAAIKKAFYRESRTWHPDRFFHLADAEAKQAIGVLYKRVTEAYYFLRDDQKRKKYLADVTGSERTAKLRFTEASESEAKAQAKKEQEEQIGTHPKGRQFYATAAQDMASENWQSAERNLKMAMTYEPANARYKEALAQVQNKLHEAFKAKGEQFKIK